MSSFGELPTTADMPADGGVLILNGTTAPADGVGDIGNFYMDTSAKILYGPKKASAPMWPVALKSA